MLAALVVVLRALALICGRHRAVALENLALRQQLAVFRRTVKRPPIRGRDRLFWMLLANTLRKGTLIQAKLKIEVDWPPGSH